jgi:hypothetical protein
MLVVDVFNGGAVGAQGSEIIGSGDDECEEQS